MNDDTWLPNDVELFPPAASGCPLAASADEDGASTDADAVDAGGAIDAPAPETANKLATTSKEIATARTFIGYHYLTTY